MRESQIHRPEDYPILSSHLDCIQAEYDVVVVGSGYGAGVAASRLARAGKSVAILEVGWEIRPGSFPETLSQSLSHFNVSGPAASHHGIRRWLPSGKNTRLFQLLLGEGQHAFVAHGLGGGSLINAGVFLPAQKETLQRSPWPSEIRDEPSSLEEYYSRAAYMLQPSLYPDHFPKLKKTELLRKQASRLTKNPVFYSAPLTTFFEEKRNHVGVSMHANTSSGHECTGLNDGSKNTVATSYLADAWNWGAQIFCGCDVRFIERASTSSGYTVYFSWQDGSRNGYGEHPDNHLFWVKAKEYCFLGAGALGTTEILLRSRARGLTVSPTLGRHLSGNGDILLFGYNGYSDVKAIATSRSESRPGPTVTSVIDQRSSDASSSLLDGYIIQDGCIPEPFGPIIEIMLITQSLRPGIGSLGVLSGLRALLPSIKSLALGPYTKGGAAQRTATYLVVSHDSNQATLALRNDKILLRAPAEGRSHNFSRMKKIVLGAIDTSGAKIGFSYFYGRRQEEVTVHPLGGANMSSDGTGCGGVTNHLGEVYQGLGNTVYPGLICCDSSIVPTSLGVNPLATVTALAERSVALIAARAHLSIDLTTKNGTLNANSQPRIAPPEASAQLRMLRDATESIGWRFTELLCGKFRLTTLGGKLSEYAAISRGTQFPMEMMLTIEIRRGTKGNDDHDSYTGTCVGTVDCFALSSSPLRVLDGVIDFFRKDEEDAEAKVILYDLTLCAVEGPTYRLQAQKFINSQIAFSPSQTWYATTSCRVEVSSQEGAFLGSGELCISRWSFQKQLRAFRPTQSLNQVSLLALLIFFGFWIRELAFFFFIPIMPARGREAVTYKAAETKQNRPIIIPLTASDSVVTKLEVFDPTCKATDHTMKPPILCLPGVTGVGTEHNLYSIPFIRCNMTDYFTKLGYRCYVLTPRWGCHMKTASRATVYDCRLDVEAAIQYILSADLKRPYVIAHCQGSVALAMGLLDGTIASDHIQGITANSVFMHEVFPPMNSIKGRTTLLIKAYEILAGDYFPIDTDQKSSLLQRGLDKLLKFYPVPYRRDLCTSPMCHRCSFAFGLLWNHQNLNRRTHDNIHRFFAGAHTCSLKHIVRSGTHGSCLNEELEALLTTKNLERLRGLPIMFVSGSQNSVFDPESTLKDYELLRRTFGEQYYTRFVVDGYGHLDPIMGKNASQDVYWKINQHLEMCCRAP